jgi:hypothetical protein
MVIDLPYDDVMMISNKCITYLLYVMHLFEVIISSIQNLLIGFFFFILVCILQSAFFAIIYKRKPNSYMQGLPCEAIGWHEFLGQSEEVELFGRNRSDGSPIRFQPQN